MLLFFEFFPEKNNPQKEKINGTCHSNIFTDLLPGIFHSPAPVYIIKNKYRIIIDPGHQVIKIIKGWQLQVIAINKG